MVEPAQVIKGSELAARRSLTRSASSPLRAFGSALDSRGVDLDGNGYAEAFSILIYFLNPKNLFLLKIEIAKKNIYILIKIKIKIKKKYLMF
jgi:hypothetical protein